MGYGPQEYFQRAAQMQMETDPLPAPAMGGQHSRSGRQAAEVQPQEPSAPHPSELMLQMVMSQMAAMSEQLARLQAAQNVILQGRSPKRPREPGGRVTGAPQQDQSGVPGGTNINQELEEGEEMEEGDDDEEVDFVSNNTASRYVSWHLPPSCKE